MKKGKLLIRGLGASAGKAKGKARVVRPGKANSLKPGEILVTKITDASMFVAIMRNAAAIVTDLGGVGSHPAIVARELGIPAVVATQKATQVIKTGMQIIVDGDRGEVHVAD